MRIGLRHLQPLNACTVWRENVQCLPFLRVVHTNLEKTNCAEIHPSFIYSSFGKTKKSLGLANENLLRAAHVCNCSWVCGCDDERVFHRDYCWMFTYSDMPCCSFTSTRFCHAFVPNPQFVQFMPEYVLFYSFIYSPLLCHGNSTVASFKEK